MNYHPPCVFVTPANDPMAVAAAAPTLTTPIGSLTTARLNSGSFQHFSISTISRSRRVKAADCVVAIFVSLRFLRLLPAKVDLFSAVTPTPRSPAAESMIPPAFLNQRGFETAACRYLCLYTVVPPVRAFNRSFSRPVRAPSLSLAGLWRFSYTQQQELVTPLSRCYTGEIP